MVKAKKSKKETGAVDENLSDSEIKQTEVLDDEPEVKKNVKKPAKEKKKASGKSAEIEDSDDDVEIKEKGEKKKEKKMSAKQGPVGFSLLMDDDEDVDDDDADVPKDIIRDDDDDEDIVPAKGKKKNQKKSQKDEEEEKPATGKASKKSKKKKRVDSDDEEMGWSYDAQTGQEDPSIEKMLAELDLGAKKEGFEEPETEKDKKDKKSKKKDAKKEEPKAADEEEAKDDEKEGEFRLKSAAEKRKEKKEREKKKKQESSKKEATPPVVVPVVEEPEPKEEKKDDKKPKKKGKKEEPVVEEESKKEETSKEGDKKKKGPNKAMVAIMQERLRLIREEEERLKREEEEKIRLAEEAENFRLEQLRLEQERKDKKKQKEKERKERLKAEGKLLTNKQKQDRARAQAMLESLKAQGVEIPEKGEKKVRPGTRIRPNKKQKEEVKQEGDAADLTDQVATDAEKTEEAVVEEKKEVVKESWDASESDNDDDDDNGQEATPEPEIATTKNETAKPVKNAKKATTPDDDDSESEESESEDEDSDESESEEDHKTDAERAREKAHARIAKRTQDAEKKKSIDNLRAAVVCVLGHVDTGKTKILDKLRRTNVQDAEAGGITQQIGATNVPIENIKEQTKFLKGFADVLFKLPGLLIIDTPGHESFSNLRSRGSSLCDIAILVVDIMHGLEPQTIESLNLLKSRKTPFIVALNKIDRLYDWQTMARRDVRDIIKAQAQNTQLEFQQRTKEVIVQFAEQGMNAALFYDNPDTRSYVSLVPTSAITGEGMGNLLFLIVQSCQNQLAKRLMYSEDLHATVLEVKAIPGLGTTIDAILVNGKLREGDTMILAGTEGPIVTQIKALLMPQPMKELRVKNAYIEHKEVMAAQGVKIAAKELEKAIAGLNLQIAQKPDEVEIFKDIVARDLKSVLNSIKLSDRGVYVQASTLGSLEALLEFLKQSKIPYSGIRIGPVVKRDVMKASTMLEHENTYATILAFDVKIERDAQELADHLGVKVFQADIIYHLFDKFMAYRDEIKQRKRDEFKSIAVFPCKLKILPQFIFNTRDPIVMGVMVEAGIVKEGTPICVPNKEFVDLGVVTSIESNHKQIETARKGQEVCIKIEPIPGETPKLFGRHFDENDILVSKISRQSIDACKDYFRDDLLKSDWSLMVELKKTFQIL